MNETRGLVIGINPTAIQVVERALGMSLGTSPDPLNPAPDSSPDLSPEFSPEFSKDQPKITLIHHYLELELMLLQGTPPPFEVIICGEKIDSISLAKLVESLRAEYPRALIIGLLVDRKQFDLPLLTDSGMNNAYLFPLESDSFIDVVRTCFSKSGQIEYIPVFLQDIPLETPVGADLHLEFPANKKQIRIVSGQNLMDPEMRTKLLRTHYQRVGIRKTEIPKFFNSIQKNEEPLSELRTSKLISLQTLVRRSIGQIWFEPENGGEFSDGVELMNRIEDILEGIQDIYSGVNLFVALFERFGGKSSPDSHALATATFSFLISAGTGIGNPQELMTAGLVHDLGEVMLPQQLFTRLKTKWSVEENRIYETHPDATVNLLRSRKINLPDNVTRTILLHHQRFDGLGYPKGYSGSSMSKEAQIIGISDRFDELIVAGKFTGFSDLQRFASRPEFEGQFDPDVLSQMKKMVSKI